MMNFVEHLEPVVAELENSVNINRIKKLLYFVVYGKWEGNQQKLKQFKLKQLIGDLLELDYNLSQLDGLLKEICSKINKQVEYLAIAHQIVKIIEPLYSTRLEEGSTRSTSLLTEATQAEVSTLENYSTENYSTIPTTVSSDEEDGLSDRLNNDLFEVRLKLVQRTNPLRVKILIFSALQNQVFNFSESEWSALKKERLDQLLKKLLLNCHQKKDLENRLYKTAKKFKNKNEAIQVASAIVKHLSPLYPKNSSSSFTHPVNQGNVEINPPESIYNNSLNQAIADEISANNPESNGANFHKSQAIADDLDRFPDYQDPGEMYAAEDDLTVPELQTSVSEKSQAFNEISEQYPGQIYAAEDDLTVPELQTSVSEHLADSNSLPELPESYPERSVKSPEPRQQISKVAKGLKITEFLKRQLELEEDIQHLVNGHVNRIMEEIETSLSELEHLLDDRLETQDAVKASSLKFNSLKDMIARIQGNTSKYLDLLNEMQSAEIQQLEASQRTSNQTNYSHETASDTKEENSEAKIIELAKEGNAKAIAALMNHYLKSRGINTLAAIKNDCLHIVLESDKEPNQQVSINLVRQKVLPWQISSITKVKVHWRQPGSKSAMWSQEFIYTLC